MKRKREILIGLFILIVVVSISVAYLWWEFSNNQGLSFLGEELFSVKILCDGNDGVQSTSKVGYTPGHDGETFMAVSVDTCPLLREGTTYIIIDNDDEYDLKPNCSDCVVNESIMELEDGIIGRVGTIRLGPIKHVSFVYTPQ